MDTKERVIFFASCAVRIAPWLAHRDPRSQEPPMSRRPHCSKSPIGLAGNGTDTDDAISKLKSWELKEGNHQ